MQQGPPIYDIPSVYEKTPLGETIEVILIRNFLKSCLELMKNEVALYFILFIH